jgi:hypothetical protein
VLSRSFVSTIFSGDFFADGGLSCVGRAYASPADSSVIKDQDCSLLVLAAGMRFGIFAVAKMTTLSTVRPSRRWGTRQNVFFDGEFVVDCW